MSFPLDYIAYDGRVPGAGSQSSWRLSLQASLPYSLGEGVNLFVRSLIPIVLDQYLLGPELFMTKIGSWGAAGLLVTHQWDVAGEDSFDTSGRHGSRLSACVCSEAIGRHFEKMVF